MGVLKPGELPSFEKPAVSPDAASAQPPIPGGPSGGTEPPEGEARTWESKYHRLAAETAEYKALADRFANIGGARGLADLIDKVLPLVARPDFTAYVRGDLAAAPVESDHDEFLTEEQREIRELQRKVHAETQNSARTRAATQRELAMVRIEREEAQLRQEYGAHYEAKRPQILEQIKRMVASGGPEVLDTITYPLLHQAFVASFPTPREFQEFAQHWAEGTEGRRRQELQAKSTTLPHSEAPAGSPTPAPKNVQEAVSRGLGEARQAWSEGRTIQ